MERKEKKRPKDLMMTLGLNKTIDQLAMANSVCWHGQVLRRKDGHDRRRALNFEDEGRMKKGRSKRVLKRRVEEGVKVG